MVNCFMNCVLAIEKNCQTEMLHVFVPPNILNISSQSKQMQTKPF